MRKSEGRGAAAVLLVGLLFTVAQYTTAATPPQLLVLKADVSFSNGSITI